MIQKQNALMFFVTFSAVITREIMKHLGVFNGFREGSFQFQDNSQLLSLLKPSAVKGGQSQTNHKICNVLVSLNRESVCYCHHFAAVLINRKKKKNIACHSFSNVFL